MTGQERQSIASTDLKTRIMAEIRFPAKSPTILTRRTLGLHTSNIYCLQDTALARGALSTPSCADVTATMVACMPRGAGMPPGP